MKNILLIISVLILFISCGQAQQKDKAQATTFINSDSREISSFFNLPDTISKDGWVIKSKPRSKESKDLILEWQKGTLKGEHFCEEVLGLKSYSIPKYIGENKDFLYLSYACATECNALLLLPKNGKMVGSTIIYVIAFDIVKNKVLQTIDDADEPFKFALALIDPNTHKIIHIKFKNQCVAANSPGIHCIDSVRFDRDQVFIKAKLSSVTDRSKTLYEIKHVRY